MLSGLALARASPTRKVARGPWAPAVLRSPRRACALSATATERTSDACFSPLARGRHVRRGVIGVRRNMMRVDSHMGRGDDCNERGFVAWHEARRREACARLISVARCASFALAICVALAGRRAHCHGRDAESRARAQGARGGHRTGRAIRDPLLWRRRQRVVRRKRLRGSLRDGRRIGSSAGAASGR